MKYVFLALFVIFSAIHLYHSFKDEKEKRAKTKGLLLPMIVCYYLSSIGAPDWVLVAALATSWLGDVLLIGQGTKWFLAGGVSFLVSHCLFIAVYVPRVVFESVNLFIVIPVAAVYAAAAIVVLAKLKKTTPKGMFVPMLLYLLTNGTMNVFALMQLLSNPCAGSVVAYIGAVFFFISDCSLYLLKYYEKPIVYKKHFTVMLTYLIGEFLITQGIMMLTTL